MGVKSSNGRPSDYVLEDIGPDGLRPDAGSAIGRLASIMVAEAMAMHCGEIVLEVRDDGCPMHYLRSDERLERDTLPVRLFRPLKNHLARMCGKDFNQDQGTFALHLKKGEPSVKVDTQVSVSVVFGESSLRLTLAENQP